MDRVEVSGQGSSYRGGGRRRRMWTLDQRRIFAG
jgi:hypothetical protein